MTLGDATHSFHVGGCRKPYLVDVVAGQTLLIEVLPASVWVWKRIRPARLRIRSGDDQVVLEAHP